MQQGGLPVLVPRTWAGFKVSDLVNDLDALLLQGGSDVSPRSYKEINEEWPGDYERDQYEIELIQEFARQKKPILGVCRGMQILNVAYNGTLYQDIETQVEGAMVHRDWNVYDSLQHEVIFTDDSLLRKIYNADSGRIISIHHQAVANLSPHATIEAVSEKDNIIEAIKIDDSENFIYGVQWHPEFQRDPQDGMLKNEVLLDAFLTEVKKRK